MTSSQRIAHSLTGSEMAELNPGVKIITYDELKHVTDIDELLHPAGKLIILHMQGANYGHWVCVFVRDNTINYFCPYGLKPDSKKYTNIPDDVYVESGQIFSLLSELLIDSRYKKIMYNEVPYQELNDKVNSCGRWCTVRLWLSNIGDKLFKKFMFYFEDREELVMLLTDNVLSGMYVDPLSIVRALRG